MTAWTKRALIALLMCVVNLPLVARAEPYLALMQGQKCVACHVNPTGGGLRNAVGQAFAQNVMPAAPLPSGMPAWNGSVGQWLQLGADLRHQWSRTEVPGQRTQRGWELGEFRAYADVSLLPGRLGLHLDQLLAPGSSNTREAYVRFGSPDGRWMLKGGQFYLPFGWRLQDNSAFVRQVTGINMLAPDSGIEVGFELPQWSMQMALTNGAANTGTGSGHQLTGQLVWIRPRGRIGLAASGTQSDAGNRRMAGIFGGLRTGPLIWLGELDIVRDAGFPEGRRSLRAGLGEVNWVFRQGHNLKFTAEYFDPDRNVREDHKARASLVYELTPLPLVQLRFGARRWDGIPQNALDNRRMLFFEVHAFL